MNSLFLYGAGPLAFLTFLFWIQAIIKICGFRERKIWFPLLIGLGAGIFVFSSTRLGFKVLSDETNLLSVANMLALFGQASNTEMWTYYYHTFHPVDFNVPTRPIFFPLLTALVHGLIGVNPWSPFVVNFFCFIGLTSLSVYWSKKNILLAILCVLTCPLLLIVATSAGFDLASLFFGFLSFYLLVRFQEKKDEATLWALCFSVFCFASVRYESLVVFPLLVFAVWWMSGRCPWKIYALGIFLLLPLLLQRYLGWGNFENPEGVPAFSFQHFKDHMLPFLRAFFWQWNGPYPIVLHWLGVGGLCLVKWKKSNVVALGYAGFLLVLLLSHHFGFAGHPTQARLFLPLSFALCLLAVVALGRLENYLPKSLLLLSVGLLFFLHRPYSLHDPLSTQLTMVREMRFLQEFMNKEERAGDVFVYDRPGQLTALGKSALSWNYFKKNQEELRTHLQNRLYQRFFLIERLKKDSEFSKLGKTKLLEHQLTPEERLQVSLWQGN